MFRIIRATAGEVLSLSWGSGNFSFATFTLYNRFIVSRLQQLFRFTSFSWSSFQG